MAIELKQITSGIVIRDFTVFSRNARDMLTTSVLASILFHNPAAGIFNRPFLSCVYCFYVKTNLYNERPPVAAHGEYGQFEVDFCLYGKSLCAKLNVYQLLIHSHENQVIFM